MPRTLFGLQISEVIALLAMLATIGQVIFARMTLIYASQPFVHFKGLGVPHRIVDINEKGQLSPRAWGLTFDLENSGNTAALNMEVNTNATFRGPEGLPIGFDYPDIVTSNTIIPSRILLGPKNSIGTARLDFHQDDLTGVWRGTARLFIWGWVEYDHVFWPRKRHRLEFCIEILVGGDPTTNECPFRWMAAPGFNGADQSCYRKVGTRARTVWISDPVWPPPAAR